MSKTRKRLSCATFLTLFIIPLVASFTPIQEVNATVSSEQDAVITGDPVQSRTGISNYIIGPLGFYWPQIVQFCDVLDVQANYDGFSQVIEKVWLPLNLRFITVWVPKWGSGIARANTTTTDIPFDPLFDEFLSACDKYGVAVMFFWPKQWSIGDTQWDKDVYAQFPDLVTFDQYGNPITPYSSNASSINCFTIDDPRYEMQLKEDLKQLYEHYGHHPSWVGVGQFEGDFSHYASYKGSGFKEVGCTPYTMRNYVYSKYFKTITDIETGLHKEDGTPCKLYEMFRSSVPIKWGTWQDEPLYWDIYNDATDQNNRNMHFVAVKFLATENLDGFKIVWYGRKVGSPPPLYVELYRNAGPYDSDNPDGYPCGIGAEPMEGPYEISVTSSESWQDPITFSSSLAKSDFYWLVFYTTGGDSSNDYQIWKRPYQVDESVIKWYYDSPAYNPGGYPPWHWGGSAVLKIQNSNGEDVKVYPRQWTTSVTPVIGVAEIPFETSEPTHVNTVFFHVSDRYWDEATTRIDITRVSDGQILATGYLDQQYLRGIAWWVPVELDNRVMLEPNVPYKLVITGPGTNEGAFQFHSLQTDPAEYGFQGQSETFLFKLADMDLIVKHYSRSQLAAGLDNQRNLPGVTNTYIHAVRFKPTLDSTLSSVTIDMMTKTGSPGDLKIALRADYDGTGEKPSNSDLDSVTISASSIPTSRTILTASEWSGVNLQASNWYWIVFSATSGHPNNYYQISYSVSPYQFKWMASPDGGGTWVTPRTNVFEKLSGGTTGYSIGELHVRVTTAAGEVFDGIDPFDRIQSSGEISLSTDDFVAQSFKPTENLVAKGVLIAQENGRRRGEEDATILVELQTDSGNEPSGTILTKGKLTTLDDRVLDGIIPIDFELPVNLMAGTKYWLVFKGAGTYGGDRAPWIYLYPYLTASLSYEGTECGAKRSTDGGTTWTKIASFNGIPVEDVETIFAVYGTPGLTTAYSISELSDEIEAYHAVPYFGLQGWNTYLNTRVDLIQKNLMEWLEGYSGGKRWMTIGPNIYDTIRDVGGEKYSYYGDFITGPLPPTPPEDSQIAGDIIGKVLNLLKQGNLGFMPGGSLGHSYDNTGAITKEQIGWYYRMATVLLARAVNIMDMDATHMMDDSLQYWSKIYGAIMNKMRYYGGYYGHEKGAVKALFIGDLDVGISLQFLTPAIDITLEGWQGISNADGNLTKYGNFSQFDVIVWVSGRPSMNQISEEAQERIKNFVRNGGGFVVISGWNDWANEILGADYTETSITAGTMVIQEPTHPILKPFENLDEYSYYWRNRQIVPTTCSIIVRDSNGMPWISENSYGNGRGVFCGIADQSSIGKIGTYVEGATEWWNRLLGAPRSSYWVLLTNAIVYAAERESLIPVWWYDNSYKREHPWNKQVWYSISGRPGTPILVWLSNNNETTSFQIHLNATFFNISPEGWMAVDVANWEIITQGSGTDILINTTILSKSWRPIYIMNKTSDLQALYSNIFLLDRTLDVDTDTSTYLLQGTYKQDSWLLIRSEKQPITVQTNCSGPLQWQPLTILNENSTAEGWYYDSTNEILFVKFLPLSRYAEVTVTVESMEPQPLEVSLATNASAVVSQGKVQIGLNVTSSGTPVENAFVQLSSDLGGDFSQSSGSTTSQGCFTSIFTAPNVTEQTTIRIYATASKQGYTTKTAYTDISVTPPGVPPQPPLKLSLATNVSALVSQGKMQISLNVTSNETPVEDAFVQLSSDLGGIFSPSSGYTTHDGCFTSIFTAPNVTEQTIIRIYATASKQGYTTKTAYTDISVTPPGVPPQPPSLNLSIHAETNTLKSGEGCIITANVTSETGNPVEGVLITLSSTQGGAFFPSSGYTDSQGCFTFTFTAPNVTSQTSCSITANASKIGYSSAQGSVEITLLPQSGQDDHSSPPNYTLYYFVIATVGILIAILTIFTMLRIRRAPKIVQRS